jgi:hypothetical protein
MQEGPRVVRDLLRAKVLSLYTRNRLVAKVRAKTTPARVVQMQWQDAGVDVALVGG